MTRRMHAALFVLAASGAGALSSACETFLPDAVVRPLDAPNRPEATCSAVCKEKAKGCSRHQCVRGCNLAIDKILEHETRAVVACVARRAPVCDDRAWAECAVRTGVYADGGPPAPPPVKDYDYDEDSPATSAPKKKNDDDDLLD